MPDSLPLSLVASHYTIQLFGTCLVSACPGPSFPCFSKGDTLFFFLTPHSRCSTSRSTWYLHYTCCLDSALSVTLDLCLNDGNNIFTNMLKWREISSAAFKPAAIKIGTDALNWLWMKGARSRVRWAQDTFSFSVFLLCVLTYICLTL